MRHSEVLSVEGVTLAPPAVAPFNLDLAMTRMLNILIASFALVLFLPLLILVAAVVMLSDPGPIVFAHRRIGFGGKSFPCFKFRTMVVDAEERLRHLLETDPASRAEWALDQKLRNDPRITPIGRFLRRSSLDELPQLLNILRGEMAIVGPRPIVAAEIARYGRYFVDYCRVRPGLTGLWQISGRNNVSYRRRVAFDVSYARSRSVMMDLRIMVWTVPAVVTASGSC